MRVAWMIGLILCTTTVSGCVREETYVKTQGELDKSRTALAQKDAALDSLKNQAGTEKQELAEALAQEKARSASDLSAIKNDLSSLQASLSRTQQELESTRKELESTKTSYRQERDRREALEGEVSKLQNARELRDDNDKLRREQTSLQANIAHLEQLLQSSQQVVENGNKALDDANRRLAALTKEKERLSTALTEAQGHARDLEGKMTSEQAAAADAQQNFEEQARKFRGEYEQLQQRNTLLKQERDRLQARAEGLQRQVQAVQQEAASHQDAVNEANARFAALNLEREQLIAGLAGAQQQARDTDAKLVAGQANEVKVRQSLEGLVGKLQGEHEQLQQRSAELRHERDRLQGKADDLLRELQATQQELSISKKALEEANARLAAATNEKEQATVVLAEAMNRARDQQTNLEAEKAREEDLAKRLSARDQEIGSLRQAASDRDSVAGRATELTTKLDEANKRITELNNELSLAAERAILAEEERDRLSSHVTQQQADLSQAEQELERLRHEQSTLQVALQQHEERGLNASEAEKVRLERERVAREEGSQRLTRTHLELNQALQPEIAKGDVRIQQTDDRLTIILLDRALFDSGSVRVKPDGQKVLKRVSDILKPVPDKHIRVEGHTDNVPMASRYRDRFPTNWEFSTARATSVIRALLEQGGLDPEQVSASGHANTKPIAGNDTEEGRAVNRRIEIILFPKNQTVVASHG